MDRALCCALLAALSLGVCVAEARIADKAGKVILLTDDNFDNLTASGKWMVNLFSPRCRHCRTMEPIWELLAKEAADENLGFHVSKVDVTTEHILRHRFLVTGVPMVYLLEEGQMWQYDGVRSVQEFRDFALGGYKSQVAQPFYKAPNSLVGRAYGATLRFGYRVPELLHEVYTHLRTHHQLSDLPIFACVLTIPVTCGLAIICALDAYYTRRTLADHPHAD